MNNRVSANTDFVREKLECLELSPRELNITRLLAWGYTVKEIANMLNRSIFTISSHLRNIYEQLGIHKETDLTRWYIFKEYGIADNPFKKIVCVLFLVLSISMILDDCNAMRMFRSRTLRAVERVEKPIREKRYRNVFELQYVTA
jgi:DNA-binding CsgD family transcriptional regulator